VAAALVGVAALAPAAHAANTKPTTYGFTVTAPTTPLTAPPPVETKARLTGQQAQSILLQFHKVSAWLKRYPKNPVVDSSFSRGIWTVNVFSGKAGEIATGTIDDATGAVLTAYTGPQVAWGMARGGPGAFGGTKINSYSVWLGLCAAFLIGLADWRRLFSLRNLDLVMMLSFSVSLWYFNRGDIFTAMPLAYPGMAWLLLRCIWIGRKDRAPRGSAVWPVWLLIGATVFLAGFRIGLNVRDSNVIDVGLSGVIGAQRIATFVNPYGSFPIEGNRPACGPADSNGEIRDRIQTNGRCEAADAQGDTYGPVSYEAYLPGYLMFGWSGKWDTLPTAHATSIIWDLLCIVGLWLVGWRYGGARLAATLGFAWAAWPFSQYASMSNTNDMIQPALLIFGFYFLSSPWLRGAFGALGALVKFSPLIILPLWSGYPDARDSRSRRRFLSGALLAAAASFVILLFDPNPIHGAETFIHHTFGYQFGRSSPFSLWDWRQYHAKGIPDLRWVQRVLQIALLVGAVALYRWPRHRSPLQIAAFTGALLVGFEMVLTHWFYLYLPWFFPFVAFAVLAPRAAEATVPITEDEEEEGLPGSLVPA
jgi:hypothetical protein